MRLQQLIALVIVMLVNASMTPAIAAKQFQATQPVSATIGVSETGEFNNVTATFTAATYTMAGQKVREADPARQCLFLLAGAAGYVDVNVHVTAPRNQERLDRKTEIVGPDYQLVYRVPQPHSLDFKRAVSLEPGMQDDRMVPEYWYKQAQEYAKKFPIGIQSLQYALYLGNNDWRLRIYLGNLDPNASGKVEIGLQGVAVGRRRSQLDLFVFRIPLPGRNVTEVQDASAYLPYVDGAPDEPYVGRDQLAWAQDTFLGYSNRIGTIAGFLPKEILDTRFWLVQAPSKRRYSYDDMSKPGVVYITAPSESSVRLEYFFKGKPSGSAEIPAGKRGMLPVGEWPRGILMKVFLGSSKEALETHEVGEK
jgi:hypothetical protein